MVVDDYGELLFLQTMLKKLGFDVDGIQNERSFEESYLALNPELILATAKGKRVNGIELAEGLRRNRGMPKIILLAAGQLFEKMRGIKIENVDATLESPVATTPLLQTIARVASLDEAALLEKYRKFKATLSPDSESDMQILKREKSVDDDKIVIPGTPEPQIPAVKIEPSTLSDSARQERFTKTLKSLDKPVADHFDSARVHKYTKEIRASEDPQSLKDLENERQEFVKAMFKKAKGKPT